MSYCDISNAEHPMLSYEIALQEALSSVDSFPQVESILLKDSLGRVLANDIYSPMNVPPFSQSAMDGYAFNAADLSSYQSLIVTGQSLAGHPFTDDVKQGQCIRIMTGAVLPTGCDSVIMQEQVEVDGEEVRFQAAVSQGQCVRACGHEYEQGELVLEKGCIISPRHIALLASLGFKSIDVFTQLTVAIFSTGDELVELGQPIEQGQIYDSNRYSLIAQLEKLNFIVKDYGIIADCPKKIEAAFTRANNEADVVITSGGVSVGDADYTKEVLAKLGNIEFWRIAVKPGKPLAFGYLSGSVFLGLPGNPVSAMVTFDKVAKPVLQKLAGEVNSTPLLQTAIVSSPLRKKAGRLEFQRGFASTNDLGELSVISTGSQGSGMVGSMCAANCYIVLPQEQGNVEVGETVLIELFAANLA